MESKGATQKTGSSEISEVSKQRKNDDAKEPTEVVSNEVSKQKENDDAEKTVEDVSNDGSNKDDPENQKECKDDETELIESEGDDYKLQPMFVCCCGALFQFLGQITSHKKKHCDWIYVCPHCDRVYKDFMKLNAHKKTHPLPPWPVVHAPVEPVPALADEVKVNNEKTEESESKIKEEEKKDKPIKEVKSDDGTKPDDKKEIKNDAKRDADKGVKKIEHATAQTKSKLQIKPVEKKIPPHFRARVSNQSPGSFMGNQMRPNMMQNRGMMNPLQNYIGGFNQGMNYGMGMQPMMNTGMGNYGGMNPGMNMGNFGGYNNMSNQFCGPNMGMNMGMHMGGMNNMGMNMGGHHMGPNMGGMNMGMHMGGMNNAPNMGGINNAPNMGGINNAPNMGGINNAPNMGVMNNSPNMGVMSNTPNIGGMNNTPNVGAMNNPSHMGGRNNPPNVGGMNIGNNVGGNAPVGRRGFSPTPSGNMTSGNKDRIVSRGLSRDIGRDLKIDPPIRRRSISPPPRRGEDLRSSLGQSPPRRGLDKDRDSFRDREFRDRFDYRDEDPIDRLGSSERSRWKDDSRDRYSPSDRDRDRSDRGWSKRSMTREEFLSASSSGFFSKPSTGSSGFSKTDNPFDRNYSPRDDGPPGLGKIGFSGTLPKRDNPDPIIISRAAKIMRSSDYR